MTENTENFESLLNQSLKKIKNFEGKVVGGIVISIDHNHALVDVGLKSEGRISMDELRFCDKEKEIKVGDKINVFVERVEDKNGEAVLSREKAKKEVAFDLFEERLGQVQYSQFIDDSFENGNIAVAEAGTGLGKSLAYLFPAVKHATDKDTGPVVISCNTKHLQDQLFFRAYQFRHKRKYLDVLKVII